MTKEEYESEREKRRRDPDNYPWFVYHMFGYHNMDYLSEKEAKETIKFYHLQKNRDKWIRNGRQPIYLMKRTKEGQ